KEFVLQPQVSFILMDQHTGEVKAICGGRGTKTGSRTLNRASDSTRQPGSTFKVLSTFLPAIDTAGLTLASVQDDAKFTYPGTKRQVKNWYNSYRGLSSIRTGIKDSMNVVAVKTLQQITPKLGYDYLLNLGFSTIVDNYTDRNGKTYTDIALPMALGGLTKGVTNLELTTAFASIANGGTYRPASYYTVIYDHEGNVLLKNDSQGKQVMKASTAWLLTSAMQDVVKSGTGTRARFKKCSLPQAGKSGTTTEDKDLWYVGYTPYLTAGIWSGNDDNTSVSQTGYHKDIWRDIMEKINKNKKPAIFEKPKSITSANICTKCGKLAIDGICNNAIGGSCVKKEYFDRENIPTENCDCHIKCKICKQSGRLANDKCPSSRVYTVIYLQKKETSPTSDSPLILPENLTNSSCHLH
ncbi:MAG: penicillin-binding protein, partial [Eubacterium sp.]|nr:penicillin-binding protein [Eubacterium sp.]